MSYKNKPTIPDTLPIPQATLLTRGNTIVFYRCYCGEQVKTSITAWEGNVSSCSCKGFVTPFPRRDMIGFRFNRLVVTAWAGKLTPKTAHHHWQCLCDCGKSTIVSFAALSSGATGSCGCYSNDIKHQIKGRFVKDLTNQRFGRLVVLHQVDRPADAKDRGARWLCKCDCGNERTVTGSRLNLNDVTHCGCQTRRKTPAHLSPEHRA